MTQEAKADYKLLINIKKLDNSQIDKVDCEVFLPKRLCDPINLYFYPTQNQLEAISEISEFSIEGLLIRNTLFNDTFWTIKIEATKVYVTSNIQDSSSAFQRPFFQGEPIDLKITDYSNIVDKAQEGENVINFWITPNILLSPDESINRSDTGEVKITPRSKFEFTLANGNYLVFNNHYHHFKNEEGDNVSFTELVAKSTIDSESQNVEDTLDYLDDFLAIASFITRQRCICLGWKNVVDSTTSITFYRRNLAIPTYKKDHSLNQTLLVDQTKFKDLMETAYKKFISIEPKLLIQHAIYSYVSNYDYNETTNIIERSFTSLYSVLETLVLDFRQRNELEYVLSEDDWKNFDKQIRKWMKTEDSLLSNKNQERELIKQKLVELNRISFKTAFDKFIKSFELDLNDLWNITGKTSLTEIRNKIVHGDTFERFKAHSLLVALNHLTWIVERAILSVLGCPISESRVSREYLNKNININLYHNWKTARELLAHSTENIISPINDAPQDEV